MDLDSGTASAEQSRLTDLPVAVVLLSVCGWCVYRVSGAAIGAMVVGATNVVTRSYVSRTVSDRQAETPSRSAPLRSHSLLIL